eukprot:TRINITY_DN7580_c0_g1_i4.p1 TRINITY_DN7580_c0_g1~~TRINITY_DN7580_c0_g1_i4.p1  ORF type:complete len:272 (-),score=27.87 TRINITY_DN7580_c0_g1_i4:13-828(-)
MMKRNAFGVFAAVFLLGLVVFAYSVRIFERPLASLFPDDFHLDSWDDSLWFTVVTMTQVGYGDVYPRTTFGRMVAFMMCIFGSLSTSLFVVACEHFFTPAHNEYRALATVRRMGLAHRMRRACSKILGSVHRLRNSIFFRPIFLSRRFVSELRSYRYEYQSLGAETSTFHEDFERKTTELFEKISELNKCGDLLEERFHTINLHLSRIEDLVSLTSPQDNLLRTLKVNRSTTNILLSSDRNQPVSYTHLRAHETGRNLVCRLLLEKKKVCK